MNKKRLLSLILSLCMVFSIVQINVFAGTSSPTIPSDNLKVNVGDTIYPKFSVASGKMVYNYTVTDPSGSTIASRTFSVQDYKNPSYGSFVCKKAGKYKITWTIGGYDLVQIMVSGQGYQYRAKPNNVGKNTSYQTFTAEGEYVVESPTFSDNTITYDGNPHFVAMKNAPSDYKIQYTENKNIMDKKYNSELENPIQYTDAGNYTVYCQLVQYGSNGYPSHCITHTATLTILPKELEFSNLKAENKKYDGTTTAIVTYDELKGVIDSDDLILSASLEWQFESADVGNNIVVKPVNYEFLGEDKDNYKLKEQSITANILPAILKIKANDTKVDIKADIPELKYTITEGKLFNDDKITGSLFVNTDGKTEGRFDITQGTLSAGNNYEIQFTKGTLIVADKELQSATVSTMPEKTYADSGFTVSVTNDKNTDLGKFTFESSNTNVATIDENGNVTIKNAGDTNIIVKRSGNDTYADFEKSQKLTVKKVAITVNADAKSKRVGTDDPALTYKYTGTLVGTDEFAGELKRAEGEAVGKYDILQNTLKINDNYEITYNKATFEILDKTPQNITVADFGDKTYGDEAFKVTVTPDVTSNLSNFTYTSDNENVATISADGTITIKGAGEANITVTEAGNDEYAKTPITKKLTVSKKAVGVTSIDTENKTAVLDGILEADKENATLDFDKITLEIGDAVDETTSNAVLTNFVLKGDKAANYNITTESLSTTIANDNVVTVTITAENGTATGAAKYLKDSEVTVTATPNSGYKFSGWYNGDTSVSTSESYTFKAESDTALTAKFSKKSSGGGGGGSSVSTYTVKFETNGGSKIDNIKVDKNKTVTEPTIPAKDGFEFAGWYTDKELTTAYDFDTKVTKSFTLYAAWTENQTEVKDDNTEPTEPTTPENKITFTDVKENEWFAENVKYVFENGLMNGVTSTEFAPNANLTRGMLVTVLYRAEGEPAVNTSIPFADVNADDYFANAVTWAQQNGIVKGISETEFAPDDFITREQIAAIIYRYANYKGYDTSAKSDISAYADAGEISEYAVEAIQYAVGSGLMKGKTENTLNPKDNATRAEIAAILQRFIEANK